MGVDFVGTTGVVISGDADGFFLVDTVMNSFVYLVIYIYIFKYIQTLFNIVYFVRLCLSPREQSSQEHSHSSIDCRVPGKALFPAECATPAFLQKYKFLCFCSEI